MPAIAATVLFALPLGASAGPGFAVLSVRALVSPTVVLKFQSSTVQISVSDEDIARGYLDVPGDYRLTVNSGKSVQHVVNVMIDVEPQPNIFKSIEVATRPREIGEPGGGTLLANYIDDVNALPPTAAGPGSNPHNRVERFGATESVSAHGSTTSLDYRVLLADKVKPGNISVPLTLSLQL